MKSENKKTSVLMLLIFPSKNTFWNRSCCFRYKREKNQKVLELQKRLLKTARRNLLHIEKNLITLAKKGFRKEICRILGFE